MKEIEFHFNVPDKLLYGCRLLRKAYRGGSRVVVTAEADVLAELDQLLWQFSPAEFLPHCMATAAATSLAMTPILLTEHPDVCAPGSVLINLGQDIPSGFDRFERFLELVSEQSHDRLAGRERWKRYAAAGVALKRFDLAEGRETV